MAISLKQQKSSRYLRFPGHTVKFWGKEELCRHLGIDLQKQMSDEWMLQEHFAQLIEAKQIDSKYEKLLTYTWIFRNIETTVLEDVGNGKAPDILLTHPLKGLSITQNIMLAAAVGLMAAKQKELQEEEKYLKKFSLNTAQKDAVRKIVLCINISRQQLYREDRIPDDIQLTSVAQQENFIGKLSEYIKEQITIAGKLSRDPAGFSDPEVIHDIRVSFRKTLSLTELFSEYIQEEWIEKFQGLLKQNIKILGSLRDLDILKAKMELFLREKEYDRKDIPAYCEIVKKEYNERLEAVTDFCISDEFEQFMEEIKQSVSQGICKPVLYKNGRVTMYQTKDVFEDTLHHTMCQMKAYREWINGLYVPEAVIHQLRITFKRLRYLLDFCTDECGKQEKRLKKSCIKAQTVLGDLHDETAVMKKVKGIRKEFSEEKEQQILKEFLEFSRKQRHQLFKKFERMWCQM